MLQLVNPALMITPSHQQDTHVFADGYMNDISLSIIMQGIQDSIFKMSSVSPVTLLSENSKLKHKL